MESAPTIWSAGSRRAGSPMLTSEREAWLMGYIAACNDAADILRGQIAARAQAPDLASHSDVDLSEGRS